MVLAEDIMYSPYNAIAVLIIIDVVIAPGSYFMVESRSGVDDIDYFPPGISMPIVGRAVLPRGKNFISPISSKQPGLFLHILAGS